jgi:hypothetical protein
VIWYAGVAIILLHCAKSNSFGVCMPINNSLKLPYFLRYLVDEKLINIEVPAQDEKTFDAQKAIKPDVITIHFKRKDRILKAACVKHFNLGGYTDLIELDPIKDEDKDKIVIKNFKGVRRAYKPKKDLAGVSKAARDKFETDKKNRFISFQQDYINNVKEQMGRYLSVNSPQRVTLEYYNHSFEINNFIKISQNVTTMTDASLKIRELIKEIEKAETVSLELKLTTAEKEDALRNTGVPLKSPLDDVKDAESRSIVPGEASSLQATQINNLSQGDGVPQDTFVPDAYTDGEGFTYQEGEGQDTFTTPTIAEQPVYSHALNATQHSQMYSVTPTPSSASILPYAPHYDRVQSSSSDIIIPTSLKNASFPIKGFTSPNQVTTKPVPSRKGFKPKSTPPVYTSRSYSDDEVNDPRPRHRRSNAEGDDTSENTPEISVDVSPVYSDRSARLSGEGSDEDLEQQLSANEQESGNGSAELQKQRFSSILAAKLAQGSSKTVAAAKSRDGQSSSSPSALPIDEQEGGHGNAEVQKQRFSSILEAKLAQGASKKGAAKLRDGQSSSTSPVLPIIDLDRFNEDLENFKRECVDAPLEPQTITDIRLCCLLSTKSCKIPVIVNGRLYDFPSLVKFAEKKYLLDPFTKQKINKSDIIAGREVRQKTIEYFEKLAVEKAFVADFIKKHNEVYVRQFRPFKRSKFYDLVSDGKIISVADILKFIQKNPKSRSARLYAEIEKLPVHNLWANDIQVYVTAYNKSSFFWRSRMLKNIKAGVIDTHERAVDYANAHPSSPTGRKFKPG